MNQLRLQSAHQILPVPFLYWCFSLHEIHSAAGRDHMSFSSTQCSQDAIGPKCVFVPPQTREGGNSTSRTKARSSASEMELLAEIRHPWPRGVARSCCSWKRCCWRGATEPSGRLLLKSQRANAPFRKLQGTAVLASS